MGGKKNTDIPNINYSDFKGLLESGNIKLAAQQKVKKMVIELAQQTQALTKKDIRSWRNAWQQAISVENPNRIPLYNIYTDVDADMHVTGCVDQRMRMVRQKSFKLTDKSGDENEDITDIFESSWFKDLMTYVLQSRYWGHSLIELGDVITIDGKPSYSYAHLVPRAHVRSEFGIIVKSICDDISQGYDYRNSAMKDWVIEAGGEKDLGLFLKCAQHTIPKKNMFAFWDQFGEIFGMPIRIGKTVSQDKQELSKVEQMLADMGAAAWGLFPEGTEIEIKETTRGDAFNVYDKRIDKADSQISKGILNQTMTIDNGSSLSQSQVHLHIFENVVNDDADFLRDIVNDKLIPRMIKHGFPLQGYKFNWDESIDYTPEQQVAYETMILDRFDVDPEYLIKKYNIPILGKKEQQQPTLINPQDNKKNKKEKLFFG